MNSQFPIPNSQLAIPLLAIGLCLTILGLAYVVPVFNRWDVRTFKSIHAALQQYSGVFRYLWPLGTTPVAVLLLAITFIPGWQTGLKLSFFYIGIAIIERIIKLSFKRERPFRQVLDIKMHQPNSPKDPSHPSGDAMRVWYLAIVIPFAFGLPWPVILAACVVAAILSLGRIAIGVHYPLDVIGGTGLGFVAAGLTVFGFQCSVFS
jgi:membrane-associated phospholipid phosphatase